MLVIGSGILGLTSAYYIKLRKPSLNVLIIDQYNTAGQGDTAKSVGAFRAFFYSRSNLLLANSSIDFYKYVQEIKGFDLGMKFNGYLFLLTKRKFNEIKPLLNEISQKGIDYRLIDSEILREYGINVDISSDEEAKLMNLEDIHVGLLVKKAGIIKPEKLVEFYVNELKKLKVTFMFNTKVKSLILEPLKPIGILGEPLPWQDSRISGAITVDGKLIKAKKKVIVAAGSWTPFILDPLGIPSVVKVKKRQIFVIKAETHDLKKLLYLKGLNDVGVIPFTVLPKHVYFRPVPEEQAFWVGFADVFREFKFEENPLPEEKFYIEGIYPILSKYFPQFINAKPSSAWAGLYDINPIDEGPLVYEFNDLIVAAGTSGSGIMKADAIGRVVAALFFGENEAELYGGEVIKVKELGLRGRTFEPEKLTL